MALRLLLGARGAAAAAASAAPVRASRLFSSTAGSVAVDNPYTGEVRHFPLQSTQEVNQVIAAAAEAQLAWRQVPLAERIAVCSRFIDSFKSKANQYARDITWQMGKPLSQASNEVAGMNQRIRAMLAMAPEALADDVLHDLNNGQIQRSIKKEPVGVVLTLAPWNYPLLTAANSIFPALLAGNSVVLKHSERTPLTATAFVEAFADAGLPRGVISSILCSNAVTAEAIRNPKIGFVAFTGSVQGGHSVYKSVSDRFIDATLELGGKDAAYVASDANLDAAIETLVDGAFYNAGQSCCGIERIYVHKSLYSRFVDGAAALVKQYKLGDPLDAATTLGPVAQPHHVGFLHNQVKEAAALSGRIVCGGAPTHDETGRGRFFAPTVVADCTHQMSLMQEESFGPVVGIAPVSSDDEAVHLMNDCRYGLTGVVFTNSLERMAALAPRIEAGTVFMNRCDYLDPELPWSGVKDTGKGVSLSRYGFRSFYRLKGYHVKLLQS